MKQDIIFESVRLIVRPYTQADGDNFFSVNGDEEVVRYIRPAKTREECDRFLEEVIKYSEENPPYGRWAVIEKASSSFAGTFAVIPVENTDLMQLGYSFLPACWGRGYATEVTRAGLQYVFLRTDIPVIYAITEMDNQASRKVLLKTGFEHFETRSEAGKTLLHFQYHKEWFFSGGRTEVRMQP